MQKEEDKLDERTEEILTIVSDIEAERTFITLKETGEVLGYDPKRGVWEREQKTVIYSSVEAQTGRKADMGFKNEVYAHIRDLHVIEGDKFLSKCEEKVLICCKNGVLNIFNNELLPFDEKYHFLNALDVEYPQKKDYHYPLFIRALEQICPDPIERQWIIDYLACCLWQTRQLHKQLWLIGEGANGKDTIILVIQNLLGAANCCEVDPQEMDSNRFAPARLYGKMLNVSADIPKKGLLGTSNLKKSSGGSPLNNEKKGKDGFPFVYLGRHIFGANQLMDTTDLSDGFMRRPIIVYLSERFFEPSDYDAVDPHHHLKDPTIEGRMLDSEEMSNLLYYFAHRLKKIVRLGYIPGLPSINETRDEWEGRVTLLPEFVKEKCELGDYEISSTRLYEAYRSFCVTNNKPPVSDKKFPTKLMRLNPSVLHKDIHESRSGRRRSLMGFSGITLKDAIVKANTTVGQTTLQSGGDGGDNFRHLVVQESTNCGTYMGDLPPPSPPSSCFDNTFANKEWADTARFFDLVSLQSKWAKAITRDSPEAPKEQSRIFPASVNKQAVLNGGKPPFTRLLDGGFLCGMCGAPRTCLEAMQTHIEEDHPEYYQDLAKRTEAETERQMREGVWKP